jgi:hypothetical protein
MWKIFHIIPAMDELSRLFLLADAYAAHCGLSESTVSARILAGGGRLRKIREGGDIGVRRINEAIAWLADNWPEGAEWPGGVERPAAQGDGEAA